MENERYAAQETPNRKGRGWEFKGFPSFSLRYTVILGNNTLGDLYYIISCDPERKNKLKPSESLY